MADVIDAVAATQPAADAGAPAPATPPASRDLEAVVTDLFRELADMLGNASPLVELVAELEALGKPKQ